MSDTTAIWTAATQIADEVIEAFSELHPGVRMNRDEWQDLHEMIEREVVGRFADIGIGAQDLLPGKTP